MSKKIERLLSAAAEMQKCLPMDDKLEKLTKDPDELSLEELDQVAAARKAPSFASLTEKSKKKGSPFGS